VAAAPAESLLKDRSFQEPFLVTIVPVQAYAEARLGRFGEAEALIATTPGDCDECMLMRARIAELEGQHGRADWWFARAVHDAPSIPLMYATWGQALLERGQPDAAIVQFTIANQKGPHFADPLEGWGEALMAKNQSHQAVAKFAEADKYAPNWGRLHLKWGEALYYAGKRDEAKAQFARAAALDLTPSEKAELARMGHV
jgi:tetratricopeptide (TPR) repeat protein